MCPVTVYVPRAVLSHASRHQNTRMMLCWSQEKLPAGFGLTFQQVLPRMRHRIVNLVPPGAMCE
jgi:hypothetical protein